MQPVKSAIAYTEPCSTRYEWLNEPTAAGQTTYWLRLETAGFVSEAYVFDTEAERATATPDLAALHHRDICWPSWCGPLPDPVG
jgi:hypothetical protein